MKQYNIIETIRLFVMKAQTNKAIDELYKFCSQNNISEFTDQLILLSSNLTEVKNAESLGLGRYIEEKNRINLALLKIIQKLDDQISNQEKIITTTTAVNEQLHLVESKIDFLLNHVEKNDDLAYYSFSKSNLWTLLEPSSKEDFINANIIEKEAEQDDYAEAMVLYMNSVITELETKFFFKFKESVDAKNLDKKKVVDEFKGMNKNVFYEYLKGESELSLNQMSEILLSNILRVEKNELKDLGDDFHKFFHKVYKVKNKRKVAAFFEVHIQFKLKAVRAFSQTLIDVVNTKENVISLFLNLQPRANKKKETKTK